MGHFHEYEVKIRITEPSKLILDIKKLNGLLLKNVIQYDTYFDNSNRELTKNDIHLRIRREFNEKMNFLRGEFSYKGAHRGNLIEIRPDTSIQLVSEDEINKLEAILNRLGYYKLVLFIKKRERWKLKNIEFEIDKEVIGEVENIKIKLGSFCQAVFETEEKMIEDETTNILWKALNRLGYKRKDFEEKSYIELFLHKKNSFTTSE
ncbi:MAG: CYTH domain-containing protein [Candidatus Hodarchaeota archaeon]